MNDITNLTASELASAHRQKSLSPVETVQACIDQIDKYDGRINSVLYVDHDRALDRARAMESDIVAGADPGPLAGVPFGLKDVIDVAGLKTTGGSDLHKDYVARHTAPLVRRLEEAGAILLAKLNTMEFHYGDEWNAHTGPTRNPWDLDCYAGGSSAGPSGAVSSRMLPFAIGEDTGGSIRLPCSNTGLSGIKPTYGRLPRTGMMQVAWTMDQPGPMARSVRDVALVMSAVAGADSGDPHSSPRPVPNYPKELSSPNVLRGLRVGVPSFWFEVDGEVQRAYDRALSDMESAGAIPIPVSFPSFELTPAIAWSIIATEFSSLHEVSRDQLERYGERLSVRMVTGEVVTASDYLRAQRVRHLMQLEVEDEFRKIDVVVTPTTPTTAGRFMEDKTCVVNIDGEQRLWIEESPKPTQPFSLTGLPAVSVPCGFSSDNMPIGLQVVAPPHRDALAMAVAHAYQEMNDFSAKLPPMLLN